MASSKYTTDPTPPQRPRFHLVFRVVSDGLDTPSAQALTQRGSHAHGGAFPLFPSLPAELRLKIWKYLLAPRIVAAACLDAEAPPPDEEPEEPEEPWASFPDLFTHDSFYMSFTSTSPFITAAPVQQDPVLLRVNCETRALALNHYAPAFGWKIPHVLLNGSPSSTSTSTSAVEQRWSQPPRTWFNYALDTLYLVGELEPCDSYGFNSPMAYFLDREEARRVRRLAVAFAALGYGEAAGPQHIFGALFHVADRFPAVEGGKVWVAVTPRDEMTHVLMGGEGSLMGGKGSLGRLRLRRVEYEIDGGGEIGEGVWVGAGAEREEEQDEDEGEGGQGGKEREEELNFVQKIWRDWYRGGIVMSSLASLQFEMVRESELSEHLAKLPMPSASAGSKQRQC